MPANVSITRPNFTVNDNVPPATYNAHAAVSATVPDATAGAEGVIRLAGDLGGTAASPALAASGVAAGSYGASGANIPNLTVDAKGRLTAAANRVLTPADIGAAPASHTHTLGEVSGVTPAAIGAAPASHTHVLGDVSGVTPAAIGAAPASHTHGTGDITGLGNAATRNVGTAAGTVAAGDDSRMTNSRQCNNNFDNAATARTNLGLGGMATNTLSAVSATATNVNQTGSAGTALVFNTSGAPWISLGVGKWLVIGTVCIRNGAGSGDTEVRLEFSDNAGANTFGAGASLLANTSERNPATVVGVITVTEGRGVFFKATPVDGAGVINFGSAGATNFAGAIHAVRLEG